MKYCARGQPTIAQFEAILSKVRHFLAAHMHARDTCDRRMCVSFGFNGFEMKNFYCKCKTLQDLVSKKSRFPTNCSGLLKCDLTD